MKKRASRVLNFFAFNLLFFSLYLNFIHKDTAAEADQNLSENKASVLVTEPVSIVKKTIDHHISTDQKVSFN